MNIQLPYSGTMPPPPGPGGVQSVSTSIAGGTAPAANAGAAAAAPIASNGGTCNVAPYGYGGLYGGRQLRVVLCIFAARIQSPWERSEVALRAKISEERVSYQHSSARLFQ